MNGECNCGCCGPTSPDTDVKPGAELGQDERDAEGRVDELERRVRKLEEAVG